MGFLCSQAESMRAPAPCFPARDDIANRRRSPRSTRRRSPKGMGEGGGLLRQVRNLVYSILTK